MDDEKIVYYLIVKKSDIKENYKIDDSETKLARLVLKSMLDYLNLEFPTMLVFEWETIF